MRGNQTQEEDFRRYTQHELNEIVERHAYFLTGRRGGARAIIKFGDLSDLTLAGKDLSQADFTGSSLARCDLSRGIFGGTCFFSCDLRQADFSHASLARADFRGAHLAGANLTGANLDSADLREGKIMERGEFGLMVNKALPSFPKGKDPTTVFTGAKLTDTNMASVKAVAADFSDADLSGVILNQANLSDVNFDGANLSKVDFTGADLSRANLSNAIMSGAILRNAEMQETILDNVVRDEAMGKRLERGVRTLAEMLDLHRRWINTAGRQGQQMDLSGYDLRDIHNLWDYPLTAIKAVKSTFLGLTLERANIQSAVLDYSDFRDCRLARADLRGSSMKGVHMGRADLSGANLGPLKFDTPEGHGVRLQRTNLSGASIRFCNLKDCDLRDSILMGVDLSNSVLTGCDLRRADLTGAKLDGTNLEDALTEGAIIR